MFIPHTPEDKNQMLKKIGVSTFEELISVIPHELRFTSELNLPEPLSELEILNHCQKLAVKNKHLKEYVSFLGGGVYDHFIPSIIKHIVSRSEFYTAYTPYQAEVSQGTLQTIYEYQSLICELFDMEVSNAGMYDGASAFAEACHMARSITKRDKILMATTIHPFYQQVIKTYTYGLNIPIIECSCKSGKIDPAEVEEKIDRDTAALLVQHPNFFGILEPMQALSEIAHKHGALLIVCVDPISLGLLAPPGNYHADIAVGEGQSLGILPAFGGPYLGILTTRKEYIRLIPGRLVGRTVDNENNTGYVLVLQTREQHIRREKATSNICTNEALCALMATIYLSVMGKNGIKEVAEHCYAKSHYLAKEISKLDGYELAFNAPFFKEFVIKTKLDPEYIIRELLKEKIFAGINLSRFNKDWNNLMLVAVTEKRTKSELDQYIQILKELK
ncbi:MAG: aminomethyl-transferring glycine dehydrogenase subunit GcvPA [candidate division WOR-3 bacterium]|nr:aminomethyl-transferring glycine dehydrogenase subunit GcvPA [candidate division WOR-3 bacterium]